MSSKFSNRAVTSVLLMSSLKVCHIFGEIGSLRNSLFYLNDQSYIYPSSRHLINYNIDYEEQKCISYGNSINEIRFLTISQNRDYLGIIFENLDKCRILIFNLNSFSNENKRFISLKQFHSSNHILSICFSNNSKYLIAFYDLPKTMLVCWSIDPLKLIDSLIIQINNLNHFQMSINKKSCCEILLTGDHVYECYRLINNRFSIEKDKSFERFQSLNINCHCWINENYILLSIDSHFLYLIYQLTNIIQIIDIKTIDESIDIDEIVCLLSFSRGVFVSTKNGKILLFEMNSNNFQLNYLRKLILSKISSNETIQSLTLSPNEQNLLISTNFNQIYQIDYGKKHEDLLINRLNSFHHGFIKKGVLSICKCILFTIGIDNCLKIWNLQTNKQQLTYQFENEPLNLSVHPNGMFICISFVNIVQIYISTINQLNLFDQFYISMSTIIEYSHQGHLLVIGYENILQFHFHRDYQLFICAQKNDKQFRLIRWSHDDTFLLSIDSNNLIIRWDPYSGQHLAQFDLDDFYVIDFVICSDNKSVYLLNNHGKIKEFLLMTILRDLSISFENSIPKCLLINEKFKHLFIGTDQGSIFAIKLNSFDNSINENLTILNVHQKSIHQLLNLINNQILISIGDDGHIIIYQLIILQQNQQSNRIYREEILAEDFLLKEQNKKLNNLIEFEKEIQNSFENKIEEKQNKYFEYFHQLNIYYQTQIKFIQKENLQQNKQIHLKQFSFEKKSLFQKLKNKQLFLQNQIEYFQSNQNQEKDSNKFLFEKNIQLISSSYQNQIQQINRIFSQKIESRENIQNEYEQEYFEEFLSIESFYQEKLTNLFNKIQQLENEQILFQFRLKQVENQSNDYQLQIKDFQMKKNFFIQNLKSIDEQFQSAKLTIQQRQFIIQDKVKRTNQMENRRDELEKFAYVFNYKIKELTNEISPRQYEVNSLIQQFNQMDQEYESLKKNNQKYSIEISDYKSRLKSIEKQILNEKFHIRKFNELTRNIKQDMKLSCHFLHQPKQFLSILTKIYSKYILSIHINKDLSQINLSDSDRQRNYFEKTNQRLIKKIFNYSQKESSQQIQRIQEQMNLMREISSSYFKLIQLEKTLADLDIVSKISIEIDIKTSNQIIEFIRNQQQSNFIENKQKQFHFILNKQYKQIQQLTKVLEKIDKYLQENSSHDQINSISNTSTEHSTILSTNSNFS